MFRVILINLLISFFISFNALSQVMQSWIKGYNGTANDYDRAAVIISDNNNNIYVTGYSTGTGMDYDYVTIKYNSSGIQQWLQRYNGTGNYNDMAASIAADKNGNVYVTGCSYSENSGFDFVTIKYDPDGIQKWIGVFKGQDNSIDNAYSVVADSYCNVYVTGESFSSVTYSEIVTIKYDMNGVQQWIRKYNGAGYGPDGARALVLDEEENILITGKSTNASGTHSDYITIKYDSEGTMLWSAGYNGPGNGDDESVCIRSDPSGNVYVTGYSFGEGTDNDYTTIKYNSNGVQQWVQRYDGISSSTDEANALTVDVWGNVCVTGISSGGEMTLLDYATVKYNAAGELQWVRRYNGPRDLDDMAYSIAADNSGNVFVSGRTDGMNIDFYDYGTIKYNPSGTMEWIEKYNGPANNCDNASSMTLDNSGNVYVTGQSYNGNSGFDYATIKYSQPVGIEPVTSNAGKFTLEQNYPNPFNSKSIIKYKIDGSGSKMSDVQLILYNSNGQIIETLVNKQLSTGEYGVEWNALNYPSGVYFYQLSVDNVKTAVKKMVLLK